MWPSVIPLRSRIWSIKTSISTDKCSRERLSFLLDHGKHFLNQEKNRMSRQLQIRPVKRNCLHFFIKQIQVNLPVSSLKVLRLDTRMLMRRPFRLVESAETDWKVRNGLGLYETIELG
jgi:hypothetical protein